MLRYEPVIARVKNRTMVNSGESWKVVLKLSVGIIDVAPPTARETVIG
jgi:hypothetical protein